jgi:hypothetical protein
LPVNRSITTATVKFPSTQQSELESVSETKPEIPSGGSTEPTAIVPRIEFIKGHIRGTSTLTARLSRKIAREAINRIWSEKYLRAVAWSFEMSPDLSHEDRVEWLDDIGALSPIHNQDWNTYYRKDHKRIWNLFNDVAVRGGYRTPKKRRGNRPRPTK